MKLPATIGSVRSAGLDDLRLGFVQRQYTRASRICMKVIRVAARRELDAAFDRPVCLNQTLAAERLIPYDVKLDRERAWIGRPSVPRTFKNELIAQRPGEYRSVRTTYDGFNGWRRPDIACNETRRARDVGQPGRREILGDNDI